MTSKMYQKEFIIILLSLMFINISTAKSARKAASYQHNPCENLITGSFVANPKGCAYFFYCHNGQALEAFCPGDFWFNEDSGMCDHPSNVDCSLNEPEVPDNLPQDEQVRCPGVDSKDLTFLGSTVECGRFYICYHGKPIMQQCIVDFHWNPIKKKCDFPHNVNCKVKPSFPVCPSRGLVFYPHPLECNYFIYCLNGHLSIQQCPFYHHWDITTETCKWRHLARCASLPSSNYKASNKT